MIKKKKYKMTAERRSLIGLDYKPPSKNIVTGAPVSQSGFLDNITQTNKLLEQANAEL